MCMGFNLTSSQYGKRWGIFQIKQNIGAPSKISQRKSRELKIKYQIHNLHANPKQKKKGG